MYDSDDYIIKDYYAKDGKHKPQRWVMHYCDGCGNKRGYAPKSRGKLCLSCACKGRTISTTQRMTISNTLTGRKIGKRGDGLSDARRGATRMGLSLEEYLQNKPAFDALRRCKKNMMDRLSCFVKQQRKSFKFFDFNSVELREHLGNLWQSDMSWNNYGRKKGIRCWEIDHIIPLRYKNPNGSFYWNQDELADPSTNTFKAAWALSNLQPMWAKLNWSKGNKRIGI